MTTLHELFFSRAAFFLNGINYYTPTGIGEFKPRGRYAKIEPRATATHTDVKYILISEQHGVREYPGDLELLGQNDVWWTIAPTHASLSLFTLLKPYTTTQLMTVQTALSAFPETMILDWHMIMHLRGKQRTGRGRTKRGQKMVDLPELGKAMIESSNLVRHDTMASLRGSMTYESEPNRAWQLGYSDTIWRAGRFLWFTDAELVRQAIEARVIGPEEVSTSEQNTLERRLEEKRSALLMNLRSKLMDQLGDKELVDRVWPEMSSRALERAGLL